MKRGIFVPDFIAVISLIIMSFFPTYLIGDDLSLFDPHSGYRISSYRAPVPDAVPGGQVADLARVRQLIGQGAILIDAYPVKSFKITENGEWIIPEPHHTIPGSYWLPLIGPGRIDRDSETYLQQSLSSLRTENPQKPFIVFCLTDCWMSWNAAQRISSLGYGPVYWFPGGADEWERTGESLQKVVPYSPRGWRPGN